MNSLIFFKVLDSHNWLRILEAEMAVTIILTRKRSQICKMLPVVQHV